MTRKALHRISVMLMAILCLTFTGCAANDKPQEVKEILNESFQTTAHVKYKELDAIMTLYKPPMNCIQVKFENPQSLKDMSMIFYKEKVQLCYKELKVDFTPDNLPGKAAAKMIISAINTALEDQGVTVKQSDGQLIISGQISEGKFELIADAKNGNILKLSIPQSQLEIEILNFKILE